MSGWDLGFIGFLMVSHIFLLSAFILLCLHILLICTCIAILLCYLYFSPLSADLLIRASNTTLYQDRLSRSSCIIDVAIEQHVRFHCEHSKPSST